MADQQSFQSPLPMSVQDDFAEHLLSLASVPGVGQQAMRALYELDTELSSIWQTSANVLREHLSNRHVPKAAGVADEITKNAAKWRDIGRRQSKTMSERDIRILSPADENFPKSFREVNEPPYWLFVEGNPKVLTAPTMVAVVGTREASIQGRRTAGHLTRLILEQGFGVVSGLAEGIDAAVHQAAVTARAPQIAILGTGIDVVFPEVNRGLREWIIAAGGAVITEYLPSTRYGRSNFVHRNRLQVALSEAVCPVEATTNGGTSHTIRFAREAKKPVFGVTRAGEPVMGAYSPLINGSDPKFDISLPEGRKALVEFLETLPGPRGDKLPPLTPDFWVERALMQLHDMLSYQDVSNDHRVEIVRKVAQLLGVETHALEGSNNASESSHS